MNKYFDLDELMIERPEKFFTFKLENNYSLAIEEFNISIVNFDNNIEIYKGVTLDITSGFNTSTYVVNRIDKSKYLTRNERNLLFFSDFYSNLKEKVKQDENVLLTPLKLLELAD